jgi:hypothetical protein
MQTILHRAGTVPISRCGEIIMRETTGIRNAADAVGDDMRDGSEQSPLPTGRLDECRRIVQPVYEDADAAALWHQGLHQWLTVTAAVFGTVAVVMVIFSISKLPIPRDLADWFEGVAVVCAGLAVAIGIFVSLLQKWLVERHKAERCRLLKFAFLMDPTVWAGDQERSEGLRELEKHISDLKALRSIKDAQQWLDQVHSPRFPDEAENFQIDEPLLKDLVRYYRDTRLTAQIAYLENRIHRFEFRDQLTRVLPRWFFFASVLAALLHSALALMASPRDTSQDPWYILTPGLLAACLPAVGAGVRTYRMANEFGRNVNRFKSTHHILNEVRREVERYLKEGTDARTTFRKIWECEHTLELEHLEWLRLMMETEWFG